MVKISVIIPVYNVEDYLEETLNSILNQTILEDIEVIMVDDGSTDNSRYIIEKYALDYDNFYAYHKENEGPGIARNYGLKLAKGEYIHFMDSDDYIAPDTYEKFYNSCENNDFIVGNFIRFTNYNIFQSKLFTNGLGEIKQDEAEISINDYPNLVWDTGIWNKLYKRDFLIKNSIEFPDKDILYEDLYFSLKAYLNADSVKYLNDMFYYWRYRGNHTSISQDFEFDIFKDRIEILESMKNLLIDYGASEELFKDAYFKWLNLDIILYILKLDTYSKQQEDYLINELYDFLTDVPSDVFDKLISFKRVVYKLILKKDISKLIYFVNLQKELINSSDVDIDLDEGLLDEIDYLKDLNQLKYSSNVSNIDLIGDNLLIEFDESLEYIDVDHNTLIKFEENDRDYTVDCEIKNNTISLPISLIEDKNNLKIKLIYSADSFEKECYLTNNRRKTLSGDGFDIDVGIGRNKYLVLDYIKRDDNHINALDVIFEDGEFKFKAQSNSKISNVFIKNILTFDIISYPVNYIGDEFYFTVPYGDILNNPIKKWELNSNQSINSIEIGETKLLYYEKNKIRINNNRNKILISNFIFNSFEELYDLNDRITNLKGKNSILRDKNNKLKEKNNENKNKYLDVKERYINLIDRHNDLKDKNKNLKVKNKELKNLVNEYKSRKVIKIADKLKFQ